MSRDTRDWEKDMKMCEQFGDSDMPYSITEFSKMLPHWLQQFAKMKDSKQIYRKVAQKYSRKYRAEKERADKAEEREWKLKAAMAFELIDAEARRNTMCADRLRNVLTTIYPLSKEEDK